MKNLIFITAFSEKFLMHETNEQQRGALNILPL